MSDTYPQTLETALTLLALEHNALRNLKKALDKGSIGKALSAIDRRCMDIVPEWSGEGLYDEPIMIMARLSGLIITLPWTAQAWQDAGGWVRDPNCAVFSWHPDAIELTRQ